MGLKEALGAVMEVVPTASEIGTEFKNHAKEAGDFLGKVFSDIYAEVADHQVAAGAHELASALFRNDGFVMYDNRDQNKDQETPQHGLPPEAVKAPEVSGPEIESPGLER